MGELAASAVQIALTSRRQKLTPGSRMYDPISITVNEEKNIHDPSKRPSEISAANQGAKASLEYFVKEIVPMILVTIVWK